MRIDREELAWAAGFFDGEGSVGSYPPYKKTHWKHQRLLIQIHQCDPDVLLRFKKAVGVGVVSGEYASKNPKHRSYWRYTTSSFQDVQAVMALLWSWLGVVKREQFRMALLKHKETRRAA